MEFEFGLIGDELYLSDDDSLATDLPMRAVEMESQRQYDMGAGRHELAYRFQDFLNALTSELQPREVDYLARMEILNKLSSRVDKVDHLQGAKIFPFGSFASNFYSPWADLDLSLELPKNGSSKKINKKEKVKILISLVKNVLYRGPCRNVRLVSGARVPLVSFEDTQYNIACDVSIENDSAVLKSRLLRSIGEIDSRCRDLIFLVKFWAKAHCINDPKTGTLNSFALCLLVIFHLQTRSPPILPPLDAVLDEDITKQLSDPSKSAEKLLTDCRRKIQPFIIQKFGAQNKSTLAELFASFCNQFSAVTVLWIHGLAVCTFTGKWGDRASTCAKWKIHQYEMTVEDPFDRTENCARSVHSSTSRLIFKAFKSTADMLYNPWSDCDLPGLLDRIFLWPVKAQTMGLQPWLLQVHSKMTIYRYWRNPLELKVTTEMKMKPTSTYSNSGKKHPEHVHIGGPKKLVPSVENLVEKEFWCMQLSNDGQSKVESEKKNWRGKKKAISPTNKEAKNVMENPIKENFSHSESLQLDKNKESKVKPRKKNRGRKKTVAPSTNEGNSAEVKSGVPVALKSDVIEISVFPTLASAQMLGSKVPEFGKLKGRWCTELPPQGPSAPVDKKEVSFPESSKSQPRLITHMEGSYFAKTLSSFDGNSKQIGGSVLINKEKKEDIVKPVSSMNPKAHKERQMIYKKKQGVINLNHTNEPWRSKDRSNEQRHSKDRPGEQWHLKDRSSSEVWRPREELPKVNHGESDGILAKDRMVAAPLPKKPPSERW